VAFDAEWNKMSEMAKLQFGLDWQTKPGAQWDRVKGIDSTLTLLGILEQIAVQRSNVETFQARLGSAFDISLITSTEPLSSAIVADTDGVVQSDPRHAGGWWGLLGLNPDAGKAEVFVKYKWGRMPPASAGFLSVFRHLTTTARGSDDGMVRFVNGERKAVGKKGLHHLALTFFYLVMENGDDLVDKYLKALRGHGPDEAGSVHHMGDILKLSTDTDERFPRLLMTNTLGVLLERFPLIFSKVGAMKPERWTGQVALHLKLWLDAIGNHPEGLKWLKSELVRLRAQWANEDAMRTRLKLSREKEREESESRTKTLATLEGEVHTVRTSLDEAFTNGVVAERMAALTNAKNKVAGWRKKTGSTTVVGGGASQGSETEVEGDVVIAEGSEKVTLNFYQKLEQTIANENEEMGQTSDTETVQMSDTLTSNWQSVRTQSKAFEETIRLETTKSKSNTTSVKRVLESKDEAGQQIIRVRDGIEQFMVTQNW
jgi:hypothetical protein